MDQGTGDNHIYDYQMCTLPPIMFICLSMNTSIYASLCFKVFSSQYFPRLKFDITMQFG